MRKTNNQRSVTCQTPYRQMEQTGTHSRHKYKTINIYTKSKTEKELKHTHPFTHIHLTVFFSGTTPVSRYQKGKGVKQSGFYWSKRVSGSGISWAICKSATLSRQTTMPAPHHSVFYRPDALPAAQPTASKHWKHRKKTKNYIKYNYVQG